MSAAHPAFTPVAESKTAALCRVLDVVPKGYHHFTAGMCAAGKAEKLARKFHALYGIGCSPAQRLTRKKQGLANALLVLFWPPATPADSATYLAAGARSGETADSASCLEATLLADHPAVSATTPLLAETAAPAMAPPVCWLLLATDGAGPIHKQESLQLVTEQRLRWLGYELVRQSTRGRASWTWRRTKAEMADLYALLSEQLNRHQMAAVGLTLLRVSRQPGFAGVRQQSWDLCQFARSRGYAESLPFLFHVQKVSHGMPLRVSGA